VLSAAPADSSRVASRLTDAWRPPYPPSLVDAALPSLGAAVAEDQGAESVDSNDQAALVENLRRAVVR
jgi:hypothetical protein